MRILTIFLIIFLSVMPVKAIQPEVDCPTPDSNSVEYESIINQVTGINLTSKIIAEAIISKELSEELKSRVWAKLDIYNVQRLKKGEFKSLTLKSKQIKYKAFSMSDFNAKTICPYNKVYYKKNKVRYPHELPLNVKGVITNKDIKNAVNSEEFKKEIQNKPLRIGKISVVKLGTPLIEIKNGKIYFDIPVQTLIGKLNIQFNSEIEVKNNIIKLANINMDSAVDGIINTFFTKLTEKVNPFQYEINSINGKYCKIYITKAKISDNIINVEGVLIINKNYYGDK